VNLRTQFELFFTLTALLVGSSWTTSHASGEDPHYPLNLTAEDVRYPTAFQEERKIRALQYYYPFSPKEMRRQNTFVNEIVHSGVSSSHPRLLITAGPYGSGKTTCLQFLENRGYYQSKDFVLIDPDRVREKLPLYQKLQKTNPMEAGTLSHTEAVNISDIALEHSLSKKKNIVLQTSLRDYDHYNEFIDRVRKMYPDYQIEIVQVDAPAEQILRETSFRTRKIPFDQIEESIRKSKISVEKLTQKVDRLVKIDNDYRNPFSFTVHEIPHPKSDGVKYIVSDIDHTIVDQIHHAPPPNDWHYIKANGDTYRVKDWAAESLFDLSKRKDLKIAFMSGGTRSRNLELLRAIKPPFMNGASLYDIADQFRSYDDLKEINPHSSRFSKRFQKDLSLISKNLDQVILLDDQKDFIRQSGSSGIHLDQSYYPFESWRDARQALLHESHDLKYVPKSRKIWKQSRNEFAAIHALILEALDELPKSGKTLSAVIREKTKIPLKNYTEKGLQLLKKNPNQIDCIRLPLDLIN
jgi:dephospho-CoA kinase/hydroxymethylpyrimidine pyrophosphatase-like HAD family hydrolase